MFTPARLTGPNVWWYDTNAAAAAPVQTFDVALNNGGAANPCPAPTVVGLA